MRLPASDKLEIIGLVEQSHLPARRTLQMLGIKSSTFYRWYDRFRSGGPEALEDNPSKPDRVWNRIPDDIRQRVVMMAFEQPELSPRELATRFSRRKIALSALWSTVLGDAKPAGDDRRASRAWRCWSD